MNVILGLCHSFSGKVVTFQESLLLVNARLLRRAATGNCPDRLGWVTARLTTAIMCDTIRSLLVHPKDKTSDLQKYGVVYQVTCPQCQHLYVGETGRTLATRMKDHTSHNTQPTAVGDHCREHGHVIIYKNNVRKC